MARGLNFRIKEKRDCHIYLTKTNFKAPFRCAIARALVFAYAKKRFSHDAANVERSYETPTGISCLKRLMFMDMFSYCKPRSAMVFLLAINDIPSEIISNFLIYL